MEERENETRAASERLRLVPVTRFTRQNIHLHGRDNLFPANLTQRRRSRCVFPVLCRNSWFGVDVRVVPSRHPSLTLSSSV
jgi:hypothetical protein